MLYELIGNNDPEKNILNSNPSIRVLFDTFLPVIQAKSIITAVNIGIFDVIGKNKFKIEEIADLLNTSEKTKNNVKINLDVIKLLLNVLISSDYITFKDSRYQLTEKSLATLLEDSPVKLKTWIKFNSIQWNIISDMEKLLKSNIKPDFNQYLDTKEKWKIHQRAMLETAKPAAKWIAEQISVDKNAEKLLDIGGSHGYYGAMICRENPPMTSIVLDLKEAIDYAQVLAKEEKIDDIITFREGNILNENFKNENDSTNSIIKEKSFDVVFLGNFVHHLSEIENIVLFGKIKKLLKENGKIVIWDFTQSEEINNDIINNGLALFFCISSKTRTYKLNEYRKWLELANFKDIVHIQPTSSQVLLIAKC